MSTEKLKPSRLNNQTLPTEFNEFSFRFPDNHVLSSIIPVNISEGSNTILEESQFGDIFVKSIFRILDSNIKLLTSNKPIHVEVTRILRKVKLDPKSIVELKNSTKLGAIKDFYQSLLENKGEILAELNLICGLFAALTAYNQISVFFQMLIQDSLYYLPERTRSNRYHRIMDLGETEVRPDGSNISGFFESLTEEQIANFSDWMKYYFDYGISFEKSNGHTGIFVEQDGIVSNLVDSGFGISELLPFVAQIWWESVNSKELPVIASSLYEKKANKSFRKLDLFKLFVIEQPELHLHPANQSTLADVLASTINSTGGDSNPDETGNKVSDKVSPMYILETHSESFINRLGELVRTGKISHSDIQVLVFSKNRKGKQVVVDIKESYYDKDGYLQNWPYGFFRYFKHAD